MQGCVQQEEATAGWGFAGISPFPAGPGLGARRDLVVSPPRCPGQHRCFLCCFISFQGTIYYFFFPLSGCFNSQISSPRKKPPAFFLSPFPQLCCESGILPCGQQGAGALLGTCWGCTPLRAGLGQGIKVLELCSRGRIGCRGRFSWPPGARLGVGDLPAGFLGRFHSPARGWRPPGAPQHGSAVLPFVQESKTRPNWLSSPQIHSSASWVRAGITRRRSGST